MNVYDFDNTIYDGDSTIDFYLYCLKKHPEIVKCLPCQILGAIKYKLGKIEKTQFKEIFYIFFTKLKDIDSDVIGFWDTNEHKVKVWYRKIQEDDDVIISASPCFLLTEICMRIKVCNLIASNVDKNTGKFTGLNCYGKEKVRRYKEKFNKEIDNFYSDSKSDQPMAEISNRKFFVRGKRIQPW